MASRLIRLMGQLIGHRVHDDLLVSLPEAFEVLARSWGQLDRERHGPPHGFGSRLTSCGLYLLQDMLPTVCRINAALRRPPPGVAAAPSRSAPSVVPLPNGSPSAP